MESTVSAQYEVIESLPWSIGDIAAAAYKAREVGGGGRVVLLRRLPPEADTAAVREASSRYAALPVHPNILTHFGLAEIESRDDMPGGLYAVSEWARGISLRERIRRVAPFSNAVALDIAIAVAQVVSRAQALGLEHGYLQAEHVLLTPEGQVKVADFALAKAVAEARGESVQAESAVHSVSRLLFEMITGRPSASGGEQLAAAMTQAAVPPAIEGIIRKGTSTSSTDGYSTPAALLADLQTAREDSRLGKPLTWSPDGPPTRPALRHSDAPLARAADEIVKEESNMAGTGSAKQRPRRAADDEEYYDERDGGDGALFLKRLVLTLLVLVVAGVVFAGSYMWAIFSGVPPDITVPDLIGKQYADAQTIAGQQHFTLAEVGHNYSDTWPQGEIYQQNPMPGLSIKAKRDVDVYVSDGPQLLDVPDLSQMTVGKARGVLQDSGLPVGAVNQQYDNVIPKGIVTAQQPAAGSKVSRETAINLTVSNGPPPPPAPEDLSATSTIPGEIDLSWDDVPIAATYNVYRDGVRIASALPQTTYSDVNVDQTSPHTYTVSAVNSNGESPQSQSVTATAAPADGAPPVDVPADPSLGGTEAPLAPPAPGDDTGAPKERQFEIQFTVPRTGGRHNVQIEVQDTTGTNIVYDEDRYAGDRVDESFTAFGNRVIFRIFVDGRLIKQETK